MTVTGRRSSRSRPERTTLTSASDRSPGSQRSSSCRHMRRTEEGQTTRAGQSGRKALHSAMAWMVLPSLPRGAVRPGGSGRVVVAEAG